VRRERARLAEMHFSSPNRFAVSSFTHGSGGKKQTRREPKRTEPDFTRVLQTREKSWGSEFQGFATESRGKAGCRRRRRRICCERCDDRTNSGQWRALCLQKCRKGTQSRRRTRHHILYAVRIFLSSVYRASRGKISAAGSPRGSISPLAREGNDRESTERSVGGHRTRMPVQGDATGVCAT